MDFVAHWQGRSGIAVVTFVGWLGIGKGKFYQWRERYGRANEHNGRIPRDFWLEEWEKSAIIEFHQAHPLEGYRRLTFMMMDADIVAVSPSSVRRVLRGAVCWRVGTASQARRAQALSNLWNRMIIGM